MLVVYVYGIHSENPVWYNIPTLFYSHLFCDLIPLSNIVFFHNNESVEYQAWKLTGTNGLRTVLENYWNSFRFHFHHTKEEKLVHVGWTELCQISINRFDTFHYRFFFLFNPNCIDLSIRVDLISSSGEPFLRAFRCEGGAILWLLTCVSKTVCYWYPCFETFQVHRTT